MIKEVTPHHSYCGDLSLYLEELGSKEHRFHFTLMDPGGKTDVRVYYKGFELTRISDFGTDKKLRDAFLEGRPEATVLFLICLYSLQGRSFLEQKHLKNEPLSIGTCFGAGMLEDNAYGKLLGFCLLWLPASQA